MHDATNSYVMHDANTPQSSKCGKLLVNTLKKKESDEMVSAGRRTIQKHKTVHLIQNRN